MPGIRPVLPLAALLARVLILRTPPHCANHRSGNDLAAWRRAADGRWRNRADVVILDPAN